MTEEKALHVGPAGIEVAYERLGDPEAPAVLMIIGAGGQLIPSACSTRSGWTAPTSSAPRSAA